MASQVIVFYEDVAQKSVLQDMQVAALLPLTKKLISKLSKGYCSPLLSVVNLSGNSILLFHYLPFHVSFIPIVVYCFH